MFLKCRCSEKKWLLILAQDWCCLHRRGSDGSFAFMDLGNNNLALDVFSLKEVNVQVEYLYDIQNLLETLLEIKKLESPSKHSRAVRLLAAKSWKRRRNEKLFGG